MRSMFDGPPQEFSTIRGKSIAWVPGVDRRTCGRKMPYSSAVPNRPVLPFGHRRQAPLPSVPWPEESLEGGVCGLYNLFVIFNAYPNAGIRLSTSGRVIFTVHLHNIPITILNGSFRFCNTRISIVTISAFLQWSIRLKTNENQNIATERTFSSTNISQARCLRTLNPYFDSERMVQWKRFR